MNGHGSNLLNLSVVLLSAAAVFWFNAAAAAVPFGPQEAAGNGFGNNPNVELDE